MINRTKIVLTTAGITVGILLGMAIQPVFSGEGIFDQVRKLQEVLSTVNKNYVDEVDASKLTEAGIKAMLNELDPHSIYISAKQATKVEEDFRGNFDGIGVEFDIIKDTITVVTPIAGGPSERLGIMAGDKIVKIDDKSAVGISQEEVPKRLKGPKGTIVKVAIKRGGIKELIEYNITRDKIPIYSVDASFIIDDSDVGYIAINRFAATTYAEMMEAARKLKQQGMKKLVLDLRGNGGGYLDQAYKIADEFVPDGKKIVYTKGRKPEFNEEYIATGGGEFETIPLIVLINSGSASASEIVSGAIQDLDRGLIVGETSFGKGLVQRQFSLADGSLFRVTISKYYTPSGRLIQRSYEDKSKYYQLEGRQNLDEGENITHKEQADSARPEFRTAGGRIVLGGGGIVPDYVVKPDTSLYIHTELSRSIVQKNVIREFVDAYINAHGAELRKKYEKDFRSYLHQFSIDEPIIQQFRQTAESKEIKWTNEQYSKDEKALKIAIKAQIARAVWNKGEQVAVSIATDKQVQKAIQLFPEAAKIAKLH